MKESKKIAWIDITKGIGILAVVVGHIYYGNIKFIIFMFHMPLFFFLSGYLYKTNYEKKKYFIKKAIHLLVPYVAFLLIIYYGFLAINPEEHNSFVDLIVRPIIGGRFLINETSVFWFIPVLFVTQQLINFLFTKVSFKYISLIVVFFLIISYINSILFPDIWFPLNLNVVFASLPIFYMGYYIKKLDIKNNFILLFIGFVIVILSVIFFPQNTYDMKYSDYGIPIITFLSGIILTLNIIYISKILAKIKVLRVFFSELGDASMVIMFLHQPIHYLLKYYEIGNNMYLLVTIISTSVSYLLYYLFKKNMILRIIFLGSKVDFDKIKK